MTSAAALAVRLVFALTVRCQGTQVGRQRKAGKLFLKRTGQLQRFAGHAETKKQQDLPDRMDWIEWLELLAHRQCFGALRGDPWRRVRRGSVRRRGRRSGYLPGRGGC